MTSREDCVYLAKLAEQSGQQKDMVRQMSRVAKLGQGLSDEERNLLSVAYKNLVTEQRESWRILSSIEKKEKSKGNEPHVAMVKDCRIKIENKIRRYCDDILYVLDKYLIGSVGDGEAKVVYYKMKGDYLRYLAEVFTGDELESAVERSRHAYEDASNVAHAKLQPVHPIRLGLALNKAVFEYEMGKDPAKACQLAKEAFDDAITDLDTLDDEDYQDATLIMQLLRDNIAIWRADIPDGKMQRFFLRIYSHLFIEEDK
ncbi:14-3-3 protein [Lichtheimia hyalospora FSU 10163]|nr:14-3-3 protein [Lichtheimia hyalospora FSU 10163]